ncbi:hypothetical protein E4U25_008434 [Claviceps purpurea]|nr:hypothetical protein E4U11_005610 [Claviceps purpurea]KAG6240087.1 hypothetical protein E4U25_008434 [Claviceps purpurea]
MDDGGVVLGNQAPGTVSSGITSGVLHCPTTSAGRYISTKGTGIGGCAKYKNTSQLTSPDSGAANSSFEPN